MGWLTELISGGGGGMSLVLVGHPLDTIKVRVQTMTVVPGQTPPYTGTVDCARKIIAKVICTDANHVLSFLISGPVLLGGSDGALPRDGCSTRWCHTDVRSLLPRLWNGQNPVL